MGQVSYLNRFLFQDKHSNCKMLLTKDKMPAEGSVRKFLHVSTLSADVKLRPEL